MSEIWKPISFCKHYEVSSMGNFRSLDHEVIVESKRTKPHAKLMKGKVIKPFKVNSTGYLQIKIQRKKYSAHRIVAREFCSGYKNGLVVNHKNGNRQDNRASNLEWVTYSENSAHGFRENGRVPTSLGKFSKDHHASKAVICTDIQTGVSIGYYAAMDAVREGFDSSSISRCCNGECMSHKGKYWRFANERDMSSAVMRWAQQHNRSSAV